MQIVRFMFFACDSWVCFDVWTYVPLFTPSVAFVLHVLFIIVGDE